jgi:hypothetical protein
MTASTLARFAKQPYKTAARAVLDTLVLGDVDAFAGLSLVLRARLTTEECRLLAWAVARALDDEDVVAVAEAIVPPETRAGWPVVPLDDVIDEAAFWADHASPAELQAYAGVCLSRLSERQGRAA